MPRGKKKQEMKPAAIDDAFRDEAAKVAAKKLKPIDAPKPTHSVVKLLVNYHPVLAHELIASSVPTNNSDTLKAGSTVKLDAEEAAGLIADGRAEAA